MFWDKLLAFFVVFAVCLLLVEIVCAAFEEYPEDDEYNEDYDREYWD